MDLKRHTRMRVRTQTHTHITTIINLQMYRINAHASMCAYGTTALVTHFVCVAMLTLEMATVNITAPSTIVCWLHQRSNYFKGVITSKFQLDINGPFCFTLAGQRISGVQMVRNAARPSPGSYLTSLEKRFDLSAYCSLLSAPCLNKNPPL